MVRTSGERILLIGDHDHQVRGAVEAALPASQIIAVASYFEGIAELSTTSFTAVIAATEPIERRAEPAVRTLRQLAADARVILFGRPSFEPLARQMLDSGADDYLVTPAGANEINQVFQTRRLRIAPAELPALLPDDPGHAPDLFAGAVPDAALAEAMLAALHEQPHNAPADAIRRINQRIGPDAQIIYVTASTEAPTIEDSRSVLSQIVRNESGEIGHLHLLIGAEHDPVHGQEFLARLAALLVRMHALQERHKRLQRLAITDELTGLYNARYFKHFLSTILDKARSLFFPVTLLIFDIDNFKRYNDEYGHGVGDEILKQTASLMKRCVREHDLVARLGGDEFAVVFWEKEGPRQARDPHANPNPKPPQTPELVFERFQRLLQAQEFQGLGPSGRGLLTISAGLAVFPYHASTMEELIDLADKRLMFGAKRAGKNSIFLVGGIPTTPEQPPTP